MQSEYYRADQYESIGGDKCEVLLYAQEVEANYCERYADPGV
jgi:hypothetical protein